MTTTNAIEVPFYERDGGEDEAVWAVAEAMRLTVNDMRVGRIEFSAGAKRAVRALIAAGWIPPCGDSSDEADRLRALLANMQQHLDEALAYSARMHDSEQAAELARQRVSMAALNQAFALEEKAAAAKRSGEPEPTMTYTEIAKGLHKLSEIGRSASGAKRGEKQSAKPKPAAKAKADARSVETVAMTLPGLEDAA